MEIKCAKCGKIINTTKTKLDNGDIKLNNVCCAIIDNRKIIMCETCYNNYKNERN